MNQEEKNRREENFEWWITCIPDRIEELKEQIPFELSDKLDFSLESLNIIENYIIENYEADFLKSEEGKDVLERLASYIGSTLKKLSPDLKWYIELNNEDDMYFGLPVLNAPNAPTLSPYHLPITACLKKKGDVISKKIKNRM